MTQPALLATFAEKTNLRKRFQLQVPDAECDDFLDSGASIEDDSEQHVIATSIGHGTIYATEHRLNLIVFQVVNGAGTCALEGNGKNTLAMLDPRGMPGGAVSENA
jgi:hypothetical protein